MPLGEHLEELRRRLLFALLGLLPILVVCAIFGKVLLAWLIAPAQHQLRAAGLPAALQATSPLESFWAYMKIALVSALVVGGPWALFQLWLFIAPGLRRHEQRFIHLLAPMSIALTALSVAFLYWVMLPVVLAFFIGFGTGVIELPVTQAEVPAGLHLPTFPVLQADPPAPAVGSIWINAAIDQVRVAMPQGKVLGITLAPAVGVLQQYRVSEYLNMVLMLALGLAAGFQMPVVVLLLGWVGLIEPSMLSNHRKQILMGILVVAAVITPADPFSMLLLSVPMFALFELGLLLLRILPASRVAGDDPLVDGGDPG